MEGRVESHNHLVPRHLAIGDVVELLLHRGGEVVIHDLRKLRLEVVVHDHAYICGSQAVLLLAEGLVVRLLANAARRREREREERTLLTLLILLYDIAAVDDGGDRGCVGRRTTDTQLLQTLYERCFVVACGGHRKTLRGYNLT